uniref:Papilin, proteoglycan like sulfated glycoprotein n=1 Tax=Amphiprion percula TaxID=161767 RepID=A0A3P8SDB3_AMPPE
LYVHSLLIYMPFVPGGDYWESWGPYGECSRSCGSGVTMRTRRCITQRTDGGHNCVGPDKSYRSCNIQDCPEGSKDFREEQCSQFDGTDFQGKRYKWLPYYGAENPCELNCMPRGENFYYRHRSAVVDGTPCHPGRRDICVDGVCKVSLKILTSVWFLSWKTGEWNACSVTCGGGSQVRSVQCISHDASGPRVVEDAVCAAYAEAPPTLQTCNMHKCAEYQVTAWSCSVTCGPGEQTREVTCVGSGGMRLEETSCSTLLRPSSVQPCQMVACSRQISCDISCSRSCGSGSRERQVICSDQERNLYPVDQCNGQPKPTTVERCNSQPCYSPQVVPSVQDPRGHDNSQTGFQPYTNSVQDPHSSAPALHCSQSYYGCCPDGRTSAGGPQGLGCPHYRLFACRCVFSSYGCCQDGVTAAQGLNREGCVEYVALAPTRSICSLPRAAGSCSSWVSRYHFDVITSKCVQFWYGSCHGNSNNFMTRAECQRACPLPSPSQQGPRPGTPARESTPGRPTSGGRGTAGFMVSIANIKSPSIQRDVHLVNFGLIWGKMDNKVKQIPNSRLPNANLQTIM